MNAYFFNLTREERQNILDKHKHVYDGFVTQYAKPNEQPLYVQDFANDKDGITVSNKGIVKTYRNVGINEDVMSGSKFEPEQNIESSQDWEEDYSQGLDMIGDGPDDLKHGTIDDESLDINDEENSIFLKNKYKNSIEDEDDFKDFEDIDIIMLDLEEEDMKDSLKESVNKSLDMFRRFKNY